ncbi:transposase IS3/IS911 family protein [Mycobacterium haemophilum DSM 44634]|nr:IS3 family transposase [Mycobacterium haemophilum DSM 44634]
MADTITEIHQRCRGTYGRRRVRAALLTDYDMNVNRKLVNAIGSTQGLIMAKPYPKEFRDDVVAVARKGQAPLIQIAKDFGISEACLHNWKEGRH